MTIAGTAVVAVAKPAGAVSVTSEAELKAAFATETHIDILADIVLTDCTDGGAVERASAVTDPVTVEGNGHTVLQTCEDNVFLQDGSGLLTVRNLVITGGRASGNGGGIFAAGPVTVNNSTIAFNQANAAGGGIGSNGVVTVTNSTVDSNSSSGEGGGIHLGPASHVLTLTNSTVSNNVGGGIGTPPNDPEASVTVVNSTVTRNRLVDLGGGIFSSGSTTLVYATVVDNSANTAFSNIDTGSLASFGSVVARGAEGNCLANPTTSHGYNFSDDDTCRFAEPTDREDAGDPLLGPLAANGGGTRTLLPQPGSPLIDAIATVSCQGNGAAGITADQRGVARPQGPGCDIGAVEVEVSIPPAPRPRPPAPVAAVPRFTG
jgi:Right handed beta helix region